MKKIILPFLAIFLSTLTFAQNTWQAKILNESTKQAIAEVNVVLNGLTIAKTNDSGLVVLKNIPNGKQIFIFKQIGYQEKSISLIFPLTGKQTGTIFLAEREDELEMVTISTTRSSRSIADIPTRVEFIAGEELEEKANMKPGDIRMVLSESTGIQTQQTSPTSANAAIRIQGLDGRYTQILRDGFPVYAGAASGLGLLQTAPLDLKQIELIKGSASTLYGGGAIAGLVNLISKTPQKQTELNFHLDATDALGYTANAFYGKRNDKIGTTLFASYQNNKAYDPAGISLSAIPKSERITFNPKIFWYPAEKTQLSLAINSTLENRIGGDMHLIGGNGDATHTYFEQNKTQRLSAQLLFDHSFGKCSHVTFKTSASYFDRNLTMPNYQFNGKQYATFSEANYANHGELTEWIAGVNLLTDNFKEHNASASALRNYKQTTFGGFAQNTFKANNWLHIESGLRLDYVNHYGYAFLPRLSTLFKITPKLSSRLGGGLGYKAPTLFTEDSERLQYQNVLPLNNANKLEKSYGGNWDINYRTALFDNKVSISINQLFFFTQLKNPLLLSPNGTSYEFINVGGNIESKGLETNIKLGYEDFKLFLGYTYTDAHQHKNGLVYNSPLTAKHRVNAVLMYEVEDSWKIGLEAYTFSKQLLNDGSIGKSYLITGFMAEKILGRFSIYINFENFLDARQTRYGNIYSGSLSNPLFKDIYAPLDGFVTNGGIKFKL
jgi:outer membrane receptor for ferrienterochelin and colicins